MEELEPITCPSSLEEPPFNPNGFQSRAYQVEMFEQAMQQNIIVAMDTGSGKTQIAKLRIEAELERSPGKRIWFCAPSVVLAQQQHIFFSSQLPSYQTRLITGNDNVQFWSTSAIWNTVLDGIDLVVSTPQVLLDALTHGFVSMHQLSLLVFDEAHHCIRNGPMAKIMQLFYHPMRAKVSPSTPHVLGLTASPVTSRASMLKELEMNMNATCVTPTLHVQDYRRHAHMPILERITFTPILTSSSLIVRALDTLVDRLTLNDDPTVKWLRSRQNDSLKAKLKLEKIVNSERTPIMKQMQSFLGHAQHIGENIGQWAADLYIRTCALQLHKGVVLHESLVADLADQEQQHIDRMLQSLLASTTFNTTETPLGHRVAAKAQALMDYLSQEYRPNITAIIFVKRRSVAFALTQLIQNSPQMKDYNTFSFVGVATPAHRALIDLADMQLQKEAFADFQAGKRNICIATQVMEEGIDVQATNLVVRFDEPENFRSFVQSRGRARRPDSKFVMVHADSEAKSIGKLINWRDLERIMKELYSDLDRDLSHKEATEQETEDGDELYRIEETGALLNYDNAQQHLAHFCATLPWEDNGDPAQALTIISKHSNDRKSARIILPSSIPAPLQVTNSLRTWRTEKMAKKDAAFQTYKRLHTAMLINDNLLPYPQARQNNEKFESRDSMYKVSPAVDPWAVLLETHPESSYVHGHCIKVIGGDSMFPEMVLLLPVQLDCNLSFTLNSAATGPITIEIRPHHKTSYASAVPVAHEVTRFLFTTILGRRLKKLNIQDRLPYHIVPAIAASDLSTWLEQAQSTRPLSDSELDVSSGSKQYLLRHKDNEVLFTWTPPLNDGKVQQGSSSDLISAERLNKQLTYLETVSEHQDSSKLETDVRALPVNECSILGLSTAYGKFMLLMPSISYMVVLALRGQLLIQQGPLSRVGYTNSNLVSKALTSSSASYEHNFESLEFVGDSLLKYYASAQVFFEYPELPEGGLTAKYAAIANNARLQRAAKELGLDAYITVEHFSGQRWTLAATSNDRGQRQMSSKTLADVIEALIGAAYLDPSNGPTKDELPMAALSQVLPDTNWKLPVTHVAEFHRSSYLSKINVARLEEVEDMLGHQFQYKSLILEALTRTSLRVGNQSFQRLEFLGDAILDRIVNVTLYNSAFGHDPEHLKYRRDALVNRWLLTFLAMETHTTSITNEVQTTTSGQTTITQTPTTRRLVHHMRTTSDKAEQLQRQKAETTFLASHSLISTAVATGKTFPWVALHSINASKSYSDIIESILGAVFIDSGGSLSACEHTLSRLGLTQILHRLATDSDIEIRQPVVRLRLRCPDVVCEEKTRGKVKDDTYTWVCVVVVRGKEVARAESGVSWKHAEACAASVALEKLDEDAEMDVE